MIPHIRFKLSRPIPWTQSTPEEVRNIIAYGLSVLPEAIDVYSHELKIKASSFEWWKTTAPPSAYGGATGPCANAACPAVVCANGGPAPVPPGECCGDQRLCSVEPGPHGAMGVQQIHEIQDIMADAKTGAGRYGSNAKEETKDAASGVSGKMHHAWDSLVSHLPHSNRDKDKDDRRLNTVATSAKKRNRGGSWVALPNRDTEAMAKAPLSDTFTVHIRTPLPYKVDKQFVSALVHNGAWRGIEDGRERQLGPVTISSFSLMAHDGVGSNVAWTTFGAAVVVSSAMLAVLVAVAAGRAMRACSRDGYTTVAPREGTALAATTGRPASEAS